MDQYALKTSFHRREELGLWTVEDTAETIGVTVETLAQWRLKGHGPNYVKMGKGVFYRPADMMEWINTCVTPPGSAVR